MAQALDFGKIKDSCSSLTTLAGNVDGTIDNLTAAISKIQNPAWEGKASEAFRDKIKALVENNLPEARKQLALSVFFLASCADAYDQLSKDAVKKLKDLIGGQEYIDKYDVSKAPDVDLNSRYGQESKKEEDTKTADTNTAGTTRRSGGGCGGCGSPGGRYTYSVGDGRTSAMGVTSTALLSAGATTSSLTDLVKTDMTGKTIEIPSSIKQGAYTVTGYDYWIDSGKEMTWAEGTNQRKVSEIWKEQGSVFKNGIAVINVDGVDRYLVAVSPKFGQPGDCIDVTLEDGTVIHCIIADSKGSDAGSEWGHVLDDGSINVLEFEVQRSTYLQSGNPTTEKWNLPWDSSKPVKSIKNLGSIIGAKVTNKTVVTNLVNNIANTEDARNVIAKVAETQLNNTDEAEYVSMFGESEGTAWCSEFVSWCAKKSGYVDAGIVPKFAGADEGAAWFKKNNQFQGRDYTPNVGDILFTGGNEATHTALVVGVDGKTIHTIEGNVGDKVKKLTHTVGDSNIFGYGTPDYSKMVKQEQPVTV
jgi:hypothetical protein